MIGAIGRVRDKHIKFWAPNFYMYIRVYVCAYVCVSACVCVCVCVCARVLRIHITCPPPPQKKKPVLGPNIVKILIAVINVGETPCSQVPLDRPFFLVFVYFVCVCARVCDCVCVHGP